MLQQNNRLFLTTLEDLSSISAGELVFSLKTTDSLWKHLIETKNTNKACFFSQQFLFQQHLLSILLSGWVTYIFIVKKLLAATAIPSHHWPRTDQALTTTSLKTVNKPVFIYDTMEVHVLTCFISSNYWYILQVKPSLWSCNLSE